jgi:DNA-binding CsgD family transcriptional regulator
VISFVQHLLTSIGSNSDESIESGKKPDIIGLVDIFARLMNQSIYWADFSRSEFLYVSSHPLFLCGHSAEEVQKMGFSYYEKIIAPEDIPIIMNINENGFKFFNTKLPVEWRKNCYLSCDFRIRKEDGSLVLVKQKLIPLQLSSDHKLISTLCLVSPSHAAGPGNAVIQNLSEPLQYKFNSETRRFYLRNPDLLTPREKEVLFLSGKGDSNSMISVKLNISVSTVKQHKHNIFRKLGVSNTSEAAYYAFSNRMI